MKYALVTNGVVTSVSVTYVKNSYPVSDSVTIGWILEDNVFTPPAIIPETPTLDQVKQLAVTTLRAECSGSITEGYISSALGAPYTYPNKSTDQVNMAASVAKSLLPTAQLSDNYPFWCMDGSGIWAMRNHSSLQIQQVGRDAYTYVLTLQQKLGAKVAQVSTATTTDAVNAITWS